jgi:type II secretory pathway component PulC
MRRFVWLLSAAALAGAFVVLLDILQDPTDIATHRRVVRTPVAAESSSTEFPAVDSYSVIWEKEESSVEPRPVPSPDTLRQFILRSVFLVRSRDSARGFAAIEIKGEEHLYSEGAVLADGYKLFAVKARSVVLERNGRRHTLPLESAAGSSEGPISIAAPKTTVVNIARPKIDNIKPVKFIDPSGMPADRIAISTNVWDYAVNNLHKILHNVRIRTDLSNNNDMKGVWIDPHVNSLPYKLGFRIGDTIRSVDGNPMKSIKDIMDFYRKALKAPPERVRVIFERNKKLRVREIQIRKQPG